MDTQNERYELRQVLKKEDFSYLAEKIKTDFPYCISMYNNLLLASRDHNAGFQYEFYVPKMYPDSRIVIWIRVDDEAMGLSLHCTEEELPLLLRLVGSTSFLSLTKGRSLMLYHLSSYVVDPLREKLQKVFNKPSVVYPHPTFTLMQRQDCPLRCPAGVRVQRLGRAGVRHMLEKSKFSKKDSVDLTCHLTRNIPALGLFLDPSAKEEMDVDLKGIDFADEDAVPICWVGTYHYGAVGMLETDEGYRRRGFGRLLMELVGRLLLADGYIPHANVEPDNDASLRMFGKLEGWKETHSCTWVRI
ncbi:uncharacterized protein [Palaemon carinicauda]|uniref:uncharacterized protein n=1 Tax=Palaemon carinicauda TaxID=392227 RepID=UPI0035B63C82